MHKALLAEGLTSVRPAATEAVVTRVRTALDVGTLRPCQSSGWVLDEGIPTLAHPKRARDPA